MTIEQRLAGIEQRIARSCERSGRDAGEVTLICVSKTVPADAVAAAYQAGARHFGENYGQELRDKARQLDRLADLSWHFIGPLQRNKIKYAVGTSTLIHTVHTPQLVEAIDRRAAALGINQRVLVQLNLARETSKSGIEESQLDTLLDCFVRCGHIQCVGLMTMPPFFDEPERARPLFARLRRIRDHASRPRRSNVDLHHLSMGMSGDFEVAVEEGATLIRVGTAVFGSR